MNKRVKQKKIKKKLNISGLAEVKSTIDLKSANGYG
jgi:hypothetical protein